MDLARVALLRQLRERLIELPSADVDLFLLALDAEPIGSDGWEDDWNYSPTRDDRRRIIADRLNQLQTSQLAEFAEGIRAVIDQEAPAPQSPTAAPRPLNLFASHLHEQAEFVSSVSDILLDRGIRLFVAHEHIRPGDEWAQTIQLNLTQADGGVAFVRPRFIESTWCDQEVGWLLGRAVPVVALRFGQDPYGPLGLVQGIPAEGRSASDVAGAIVEWASGRPRLQRAVIASAVSALRRSPRFSTTDTLWSTIASATDLTQEEVAAVLEAVRDNDQVYRASGPDGRGESAPYAPTLLRYALGQPGAVEQQELFRETARARGLLPLLPPDVLGDEVPF